MKQIEEYFNNAYAGANVLVTGHTGFKGAWLSWWLHLLGARVTGLAMLGFINNSKVPLRLATFLGFGVALLSLLVALFYFVYKIIFWSSFQVGTAPLVIGLFFIGAVQLFFIGILGEYIGGIYTQVKNRPHVVEEERINFDDPAGGSPPGKE